MKIFRFSLVILLSLAVFSSGCALNKKSADAKAGLLEKKRKHDDLYRELSKKNLPLGILKAEIVEKFGEPDDVFKSGSSTGSLEVWTYDKMLVDKDEKADWETILLYFNNDSLITWKY